MTGPASWDPSGRDDAIVQAFGLGEDVGESDHNDDEALLGEIIQLPPPLVGYAERKLWEMCEHRRKAGLPPATRHEFLIRSVRSAVIAAGLGKKVSPNALIVGTTLALAKVEGEKLKTPLRDIAKDTATRYASLLAVRRIALAQIARLGARLGASIE